jgi:hypothetical protein
MSSFVEQFPVLTQMIAGGENLEGILSGLEGILSGHPGSQIAEDP